MASERSCPSDEHLRGLLDGHLSGEQQTVLTHHVEGCPCCQESLESLATGSAVWSSCLLHVDRQTPPPQSAYWPAFQRLRNEATQAYDSGETRASEDYSLDFLCPSDEPGSLGTLGHFEIVKVVGRGGMGIVLQAFDSHLQRHVAVKVLDPSLADNEVARKRFCREARAAASITHEHVVAVHHVEHETCNGVPFLVMQLVTGESLEERLRHRGKLELPEILRIGMQTAAGLSAAHAQGLIHRDIKPANILLESGTDRVKLTDFGLAKATEDVKLTKTGFVAGTPLYMAPEQALGEEVDARSDLFSLGNVLYEMATGHPPFEGSTPLAVLRRITDDAPRPIHDTNPAIPRCLEGIIGKLLEKDPKDRFQSAAEVAGILAQQLSQIEPLSPLNTPIAPTGGCPAAKRSRPWWTLTAVSSGLALLMGGLLLTEWFGLTHVLTNHAATTTSSATDEAQPAGPKPKRIFSGTVGTVWSVVFAPNGQTLAMALDDGTIKLWDLSTGRVRATLPAHAGPVNALAYSPDGSVLASSSDSDHVKLWNTKSFDKPTPLLDTSMIRPLVFSPDGTRLVTGSRKGEVTIWDAKTGGSLLETKGHAGVVVGIAYSPDGKSIASSSGDKTVKLWDAATGLEQMTLNHNGQVYGVAFSPDGKLVATSGWPKDVRLWDAGTGQLKAELVGHTEDVWAVAFSPDGQTLASVGTDRTVRLWRVADGKELHTLRGHTSMLHTVAFSPDGQFLASGGRDGTVRLWALSELGQ